MIILIEKILNLLMVMKNRKKIPHPINGSKIINMLKDINVKFGKKIIDSPELPYN